MSIIDDTKLTESSGNVFADLGVENPQEMLAKAELTRAIGEIISRRHLTQAQAAEILKIDQAKVSVLLRGRLAGFSIERLFRFLNALGVDVDIQIKTKSHQGIPGRTSVVSAASGGVEKPGKVAAGG